MKSATTETMAYTVYLFIYYTLNDRSGRSNTRMYVCADNNRVCVCDVRRFRVRAIRAALQAYKAYGFRIKFMVRKISVYLPIYIYKYIIESRSEKNQRRIESDRLG